MLLCRNEYWLFLTRFRLACPFGLILMRLFMGRLSKMLLSSSEAWPLMISTNSRSGAMPSLFLASLFLLLFFNYLDIKNKIAVRIIEFVAPLTLAVYLIHDNAFFRPVLWRDILKINTLATASAILPMLLFSIPLIFASCIFIDFFRKKLFDRIFVPRVPAPAKK